MNDRTTVLKLVVLATLTVGASAEESPASRPDATPEWLELTPIENRFDERRFDQFAHEDRSERDDDEPISPGTDSPTTPDRPSASDRTRP